MFADYNLQQEKEQAILLGTQWLYRRISEVLYLQDLLSLFNANLRHYFKTSLALNYFHTT